MTQYQDNRMSDAESILEGDPTVGHDPSEPAEDAVLAAQLLSDLAAVGINFSTGFIPYGGGFAQGWDRVHSLRGRDGNTYNVEWFIQQLSASHEPNGRPDYVKVSSVIGIWSTQHAVSQPIHPSQSA